MNLPNKLTDVQSDSDCTIRSVTFRWISTVGLVYDSVQWNPSLYRLHCSSNLHCSQSDRPSGWKDCQKIQSGH